MQSIGPRLVCVFLLALVCVLTGTQSTQAAPQDITRAQNQAAALEAQLKELTAQAQELREQYESANAQLAQTQNDAAENAALLAQAQQDQESAESALNDRLAEIYKQGRSGTLDILLSSSSWSDLLDRMTILERISKQDTDLLKQVTVFREQVTDRGATLAAQLEKQDAAAEKVEAARQARHAEAAADQTASEGQGSGDRAAGEGVAGPPGEAGAAGEGASGQAAGGAGSGAGGRAEEEARARTALRPPPDRTPTRSATARPTS